MRLGIGSYTYTWAVGVPGHPPRAPLTAFDLLDHAQSLGVRVVQFCDNLPLVDMPDPELERLAARASAAGISIEIGTRGIRDPARLLRHLELARLFGAQFVRVVLDSPGHEPSPADAVSLLRPVVSEYAAAGVKLAIENHDRFACRTLAEVVEQLGRDLAGICLDTVNSFGALEGPEAVVRTLAPYALNLHVKDFTITRVTSQMGFAVAGCPAGQGRLKVPWLLQELRAAGRDCNAILELWTPYGPTLDETIQREQSWAAESIPYLRQFISD